MPRVLLRGFFTIFFPQPGNELLGGDDPHLLLLGGDAVEEVREARQEALLFAGLDLVGQNLFPERAAEIERLEDRVAVAGIAELIERKQKQEASWQPLYNKGAETRSLAFSQPVCRR